MPVEVGGLDSDTGLSDPVHGHGSILLLDPLGGRWAVGEEEEEADTEDDGDRAENVKDDLPSWHRVVVHLE